MKIVIRLMVVCSMLVSFCTSIAGAQSLENPNIITNGDFSANFDGWEVRNITNADAATVTPLSSGGVDNSSCIEISKTSYLGDIRQFIQVEEGAKYYVSAKMKMKSNPTNNGGLLFYYEGGSAWIVKNQSVGTEWTTISGVFTVPTGGATKAELAIRASNVDNGAAFIDDVKMYKYSEDNLILNSDFSMGKEIWEVRNATTAGAAVVTEHSSGGTDNSPCIEISKTSYLGDIRQFIPVEEGTKYYISAKLKMKTTPTTNAGLLFYYEGGSAWIVKNQSVGTEWTTISGVFTVPTGGATKAELAIRASNIDNGAAFIDDVVVISENLVVIDGIKVNGDPITSFDKDKDEYVYNIPYGTTEIPNVTASVGVFADDFKTTYAVENATLEGATLAVTSPSGSKSKRYTIRFEMMEQYTLGEITFNGDFVVNGVITAFLPITNNSLETLSSQLNVTLIVGLYDSNGTMTDIKFVEAKNASDFSIAPGQTENLSVPITVSDTVCTLSAHVIDSFVSANPLSGMQNY